MIGVIVTDIEDAVRSVLLEGAADTKSVLESSGTSGNTGQGGVVDEEAGMAEGKQEVREDVELQDMLKEPAATLVTGQTSRGRPRRTFAVACRGVKRLLLCGC